MMKWILAALGLVLVVCLCSTGVAGIDCLQCDDVANISECVDNKISCGPGEQCFLEQVTTDANQIIYNGGCRSDGVCRVMDSLTGIGKRDTSRSKRSLVTCAKCCNNAPDALGPCNGKLCGQSPNPNKPPRCLECTNKASAGACKDYRVCQDTQTCANEIVIAGGNLIRLNYYCEEIHLCYTAYTALEKNPAGGVLPGRKRAQNDGHSSGVRICSSCCHGDECNKIDCYVQQHKYNSSDFAPNKKSTAAVKPAVTTPLPPATTPPPPTPAPTTPQPTTQPTTPQPTPAPTTPQPTTPPTTPQPTPAPTTPQPTTPPTTPQPTTPTTPQPTTPPTSPKPTTPPTTPQPTTPPTTPQPTAPPTPPPASPSTPQPPTPPPATVSTAAAGSTAGSTAAPVPQPIG